MVLRPESPVLRAVLLPRRVPVWLRLVQLPRPRTSLDGAGPGWGPYMTGAVPARAVWDLPPEPGPEVTAVRDCDGDLWTRTGDGWQFMAAGRPVPHYTRSWRGVLEHGPLYDATGGGPADGCADT